jgi:hypothetical protein
MSVSNDAMSRILITRRRITVTCSVTISLARKVSRTPFPGNSVNALHLI